MYTVAKGKAITCKKGILADGAEVKAEYLGANGAQQLAALAEKGILVKAEPKKEPEPEAKPEQKPKAKKQK